VLTGVAAADSGHRKRKIMEMSGTCTPALYEEFKGKGNGLLSIKTLEH